MLYKIDNENKSVVLVINRGSAFADRYCEIDENGNVSFNEAKADSLCMTIFRLIERNFRNGAPVSQYACCSLQPTKNDLCVFIYAMDVAKEVEPMSEETLYRYTALAHYSMKHEKDLWADLEITDEDLNLIEKEVQEIGMEECAKYCNTENPIRIIVPIRDLAKLIAFGGPVYKIGENYIFEPARSMSALLNFYPEYQGEVPDESLIIENIADPTLVVSEAEEVSKG